MKSTESRESEKPIGAPGNGHEPDGPRSPYRTNYDFVTPDVMRLMAEYERDWHVRHNQLLMIQDQYMPRGRTY